MCEEEVAVWIENSGDVEGEVDEELLVGPLDKCILSFGLPHGCDDTFDLSDVLHFYGYDACPDQNRPAPVEDGGVFSPAHFLAAQDEGLPPLVLADTVECDSFTFTSGVVVHAPSPVSS